jgi:hypothetical protein
LKRFEEYVALLFSLLGGSVDIAISAVDQYLWVVKKVSRLTGLAFLVVFGLVFLSEITDVSGLVALAVILTGAVVAVWSVLVFPIVLIAELGAKWEPVRRQLNRLGLVILAATAFAFIALRLPSGFQGATILGLLIVLVFGLATFGLGPTRRTLGVQMILTAVFSLVLVVLPQTANLIGSIASAMDTKISRWATPKPIELEMSMDVLTGQDPDAPALFMWTEDGSPNWWCISDAISDAGYRCFGQPGRDQTTQIELVPITPALVGRAVENLRAAENARLEENERIELERAGEVAQIERVEAARLAAEAEIAREREAAENLRQAEEIDRARVAYIQNYVAVSAPSDEPVWAVLDEKHQSFLDKNGLLDGVVPKYRPFLRDAAIKDGVFDRLFSGDFTEIGKLELSNLAPVLVLGRLSERVDELNVLDRGRKSVRTLSILVVDTTGRGVLQSRSLSVEALGQNTNIARQRSLERLKARLVDFVTGHVSIDG